MDKNSNPKMVWIRRLAREMPFYGHLGISLRKLGAGRAEVRLRVGKRLTQDAGVAHGGVAAALIDSAVGLALCTMLNPEQLITTVELKVNFIAPANLGVLTASGKIIHKGKRIAVGEAKVTDENRRLIATGLVTYLILGKEHRRVVRVS